MANAARNAGSYWGVVSGPAKPVTQVRQLTQITSWALMVSGGLHCSALQECLCLHSAKRMAKDNKMCVRVLHVSVPRDGNWASLLWIEAPPHSTSPAARLPSLPEVADGACNVWLSPPLPARMRDVFCMTAPWKQENNCPWWSGPSAVLMWQPRCKALQDLKTLNGAASLDAPAIVSPSASDSRRSFQMLTYQDKIFTLKMHVLPAASPVTLYTSSAKSIRGFGTAPFLASL